MKTEESHVPIWGLNFFVKNRNGEDTCSAYVTFKDAYALETAVLLSVSHHLHFCSKFSPPAYQTPIETEIAFTYKLTASFKQLWYES